MGSNVHHKKAIMTATTGDMTVEQKDGRKTRENPTIFSGHRRPSKSLTLPYHTSLLLLLLSPSTQ